MKGLLPVLQKVNAAEYEGAQASKPKSEKDGWYGADPIAMLLRLESLTSVLLCMAHSSKKKKHEKMVKAPLRIAKDL